MTTLEALPSSYPQNILLEDQMELSPGPGMGDDIDIDLDLDAPPPNDQGGDYIIEDAGSETAAEHMDPSVELGNDDVMRDEDLSFTDVQEQEVEIPDEELFDAHDPILTDDPSNQQQHQSGEYSPNAAAFGEDGGSRSSRLTTSGDLIATSGEQQEINFAEDNTYTSENSKNLTIENEEPATSPQNIKAPPVAEQRSALEPHGPLELDNGNQTLEQVVPLDERPALDVPATSSNSNVGDDALTDTYEEEVPNEPKDSQSGAAHIHPVVVIYEGSEISLFPPFKDDTSDTFFLPDESLARANICDLFDAIRSVLAGSISEGDELNVAVGGLGLELSEDSIHTRTTTLSQIVGLYVRLSLQDGVDEPDPLYMTLTTKVRFSKRLNDISSAAAEGKGISQVPFWHGEGQDYSGFPAGNAFYSEDTDHHPGWGTDYPFPQDLQSPAKNPNDPDVTGPVRARDSLAPLPTATDTDPEGPRELSSAIYPGTQGALSSAEDSTGANNDEDNEILISSAKIDNESLLGGGHSHADTEHEADAQETASHPAEDELRDDDLIDYDDDDDDGAGQYTSTGSSTLQSDDRRTSNGTLECFILPECSFPAACFCADCIIRLEAEYAAINAAASRRSSASKLSRESSGAALKGDTHHENEDEGDLGQPGVSGYEEDYELYNDESNYDGSQQYGDEAEYTQSEVYEELEQYDESTGLNEYAGFQGSTENDYAINGPEEWNSSSWHPEGQEVASENPEEYYQQENVPGDSSETAHPEDNRYVSEHSNLDLHFDEEAEEHPVHDSQTQDPNRVNGPRHAAPGLSVPADANGKHRLGETEQPVGVEEDEPLYDDDDDVFSDALYGGDESAKTSDDDQTTSLAHRDSAKRTIDEIDDGSVLEGGVQGQ
ncbi:hypothetical protein FGG08_000098 [Glutinoglossum americanum]|uniref:Uncharacterized protein n=1 Tax=Glutinoglossum americanum TaxID=1670608 RepID=A0A9P8IG52_9PEZI|nr:hypothetical protein FGG08_000098 [Glutinoglossum americanum]